MKKLFSTFVLSIYLSISAFSGNIVGNGGFEFTTGAINAWSVGSTAPGVQTYSFETVNPISGTQSALMAITTSGTTSTDDVVNAVNLNLNTNIACTKGASYKLTFKAKATNANGTDLSSVVMPINIVTGSGITPVTKLLDDYVIMTSSVQTFELMFVCPVVAGYCNLKFLYGNFPAGTSIMIDDVVIEEVTNPLTSGNLCNGDFESVAFGKPAGSLSDYASYNNASATTSTGWTQFKPNGSGDSFSANASSYDPITGTKSYQLSMKNGAPVGANNAAYMVGWAFCPAVGFKYTCTFKAKSSIATANMGVKLISYNGAIVNSDNPTAYDLTPTAKSFTFTSNTVTDYSFYYLLCFQVGTLPPNAYIMLDDVLLYQSDISSGLKLIYERDDVKVFGSNLQMHVTTPINAQATVYLLSGKVAKKQLLTAGDNQFYMPKGIYVVQVETATTIIKSTKVVVW